MNLRRKSLGDTISKNPSIAGLMLLCKLLKLLYYSFLSSSNFDPICNIVIYFLLVWNFAAVICVLSMNVKLFLKKLNQERTILSLMRSKTWMWLNQKEARTVPLLSIRVFRCLITFILTFLFNSFYKGHFFRAQVTKTFILFCFQHIKVFLIKFSASRCDVAWKFQYIPLLHETNEFHYIIILTFKYRQLQHFDSVLWLTCLTEQRVSPIM